MNNELSALGGQGDDTSKLQIHLQNANAKCVDLENQLQKAHGSLKNQTREINNLNKMKEQMDETLEAKM